MTTSRCLELLRAPSRKHHDNDASTTLINLISSFELSIPHRTSLKSPFYPKFCVTGSAEKIFDLNRNCTAAKLIKDTPTILLNHQIFDVNRQMQGKRTAFSFSKRIVHRTRTKETCSLLSIEQFIPAFSIIDDTDVIFESTGILFIAIVLAHEIAHAINLSQSINDANVIQKNTPKLILFFRSYSYDAGILCKKKGVIQNHFGCLMVAYDTFFLESTTFIIRR